MKFIFSFENPTDLGTIKNSLVVDDGLSTKLLSLMNSYRMFLTGMVGFKSDEVDKYFNTKEYNFISMVNTEDDLYDLEDEFEPPPIDPEYEKFKEKMKEEDFCKYVYTLYQEDING